MPARAGTVRENWSTRADEADRQRERKDVMGNTDTAGAAAWAEWAERVAVRTERAAARADRLAKEARQAAAVAAESFQWLPDDEADFWHARAEWAEWTEQAVERAVCVAYTWAERAEVARKVAGLAAERAGMAGTVREN